MASAAKGRQVFGARCAGRHAATSGAPPGPGPNLAGRLGRRVPDDAGFDSSPALRAARGAGQAWDGALLQRVLADPEAVPPGLWLGADGPRAAAGHAAVAGLIARTGAGARRAD
ncbi:c-type cytochrome [Dankookia sp. P2]|uniref:c-type cytochrome n=1 Tax=Dankookia sp. P2 TaxID=3423955 RepID=UPI003D66C4A5